MGVRTSKLAALPGKSKSESPLLPSRPSPMPRKPVRKKKKDGDVLSLAECLELRERKSRDSLIDAVLDMEADPDIVCSAQPKITKCPEFLLASWDSWYSKFSEVEDEDTGPHRPPTGLFVTMLIQHGIEALEESKPVHSYRALREQVLSADTEPRVKVALRSFLNKGCAYTPASPWGETEQYYFRTTPEFMARLKAVSAELGVPYGTLAVVCWGWGLACQEVHPEERKAFLANWEEFVEEITTRSSELKLRYRKATKKVK